MQQPSSTGLHSHHMSLYLSFINKGSGIFEEFKEQVKSAACCTPSRWMRDIVSGK